MLAAASWRQALQVFQASDDSHAWQLRETQLDPYLALESVPILPGQTETNVGPAVPALMDYHVCYSHSYQVPIMVFRAMSMDGAALGLDALQDVFPSWPRAREQLLAFALQQEHPLLPGPCWFSLHPCNTATVLALALGLDADAVQPTGGGDAAGGATGAADAAAAVDAAAEGGDAGAHHRAGRAGSPRRPASPVAAAAVAGACAAHTTSATTAAAAVTPTAAAVGAVVGGAPGGVNDALSDAAAAPAFPRDPLAFGSGAGDAAAAAAHGTRSRRGPADQPVVARHRVAPITATGDVPDAVEQVPDLDQLLADFDRPPHGLAAGLLGPGAGLARAGSLAERSEGGRMLGGQAMVGPAGVRWPGGEVPLCPGEGWLRRYMGAWFSLVGPQVGLWARTDR